MSIWLQNYGGFTNIVLLLQISVNNLVKVNQSSHQRQCYEYSLSFLINFLKGMIYYVLILYQYQTQRHYSILLHLYTYYWIV